MRTIPWLIHEPNRFAFLREVASAPGGCVLFRDIVAELNADPHALTYHARVLAQAGLVTVEKKFNGITAWNWFSITPKGRQVLADLRRDLDAVLEAKPEEAAA